MLREHTHGPDQDKGEALIAVEAMKERAEITKEALQQILTRGVENLSQGAAARLPNISTGRRNIRRHRQRAANPLPVPQTREEIPHSLPERYQVTANGANFLLYDSQDDDMILVLGTEQGLQILERSLHWLMDGTFKTVPPHYLQLYTIHALFEGRVVGAVYALLQQK